MEIVRLQLPAARHMSGRLVESSAFFLIPLLRHPRIRCKATREDFHVVRGSTTQRLFPSYRNYGSEIIFVQLPSNYCPNAHVLNIIRVTVGAHA